MKPTSDRKNAARRSAAEAQLKKQKQSRPPQSAADVLRLQHELEVHKVELEMQNAELCATQAKIEAGLERYTELFDFAPVGYFDLSADGTIRFVNLTGAKLVGMGRSQLIGRRLGLLVAESDRRIFNEFLARIFKTKEHATCELALASEGRPARVIQLDAKCSPDGGSCRVAMLDITARWRAEAKQRQSEERYAALFDRSLDCVYLHDFAGNFLDANQAALDLLGYQPEDIAALNFASLLTEDQLPLAFQITEEVKTTGRQVQPAEFRVRHKYGRQVEVEISSSLIYHEGKPYAVQGIARDLTSRKRIESLQREQFALKGQLTKIVAAVPGVIYTFLLRPDGSACFPYASPAIEKQFGFATGQLAQDAAILFAKVHPADIERVQAGISKSARTLTVWSDEFRFQHPAKGEIWIFGRAVPHREADGSTLWHGFTTEVTERRRKDEELHKSQALYSSLLTQLPVGVFEKDQYGRYVLVNPEFCRIKGMKADEFLGKLPVEVCALDISGRGSEGPAIKYAAAGEDHHRQIMQTGSCIEQDEEYVQADGTKKYMHVRKFPVFDANREVIGSQGVLFDITTRKQAETDLIASEVRYRSLFNNMVEGCAYCRMIFKDDQPDDFVYLAVNPAFEKLTGLRDVVGKNVSVVIPGLREADPELFAAYCRVVQTGVPERLEIFVRALDMWFSISAYKPEAGCFVAVFDVIDARKRAEAALQASENRFRKVFEMAPLAMCQVTKEGVIAFRNKRFIEVFGYTADEVPTVADWWPRAYPDPNYRQSVIETWNAALTRAATVGRDITALEYRVTCKSGEECIVEMTGTMLEEGYLTIFRDLTARKRAEAALRESERLFLDMMSRIKLISLMLDSRARITYCNDYLLTLTGWRREEVIGQNWLELFIPSDVIDVKGVFEKLLKDLPEAWHYENEILTKAGGRRLIRWNNSVLRSASSEVIGTASIGEDITERKRVEEQLGESEERFRQMAERINKVFWMCNKDMTQVLYVSPAYAQIWGRPCSTLYERPASFVEAAHPEDLDRLMAAIAVKKQGRETEVQYRISHPDGSVRWILARSFPVLNEGGEFYRIAGVAEDITERKESEAALRTSEEQFRAMFELASIGMAQANPRSGQWLRVNQKMCDITGYTADEMMRMKVPEITHPEDRQKDWDLFQQVVRGERPAYRLEKRYVRKDSNVAWVNVNMSVIRDAAGEPQRTVATIEDITQRKENEQSLARLATAIDQAAESVVITDTCGAILYVNPAFEKTTGYTSQEVLGMNPRMLKSGKQDAEFYREMWNTLGRGEVWHGHFSNQRKDGTLFEEEATISPIRDANGEVVSYVAVKRDVTKEMQLDSQIRQAQKMEAMGTLAGGIAHDFNNILTVMFGYCYMLQLETKSYPSLDDQVGEILRATNRAKELVQQILTFSRQREQKREIVRLHSVVKEATKFLRASLPASITIDVNAAPDAPPVLADLTQVYQVTMNLATNALHAMEDRQGRLSVSLETFTPDSKLLEAQPKLRPIAYARLTVADTGHGMDARTMERIFEPFFTTKPVGKGTGLGLSVVHGIVEAHDGVVTVESQLGKGTTFAVYFPGQLQDESLTNPLMSDLPLGGGQKILLLDDEIVVTNMFKRMLKVLNYQVTTCNRPREAVALFQKKPDDYDLVITDLTMPEMNGLEVASQIGALRPQLPIILISGFTLTLTAQNLHEAGICKLLEKPVSMVDLAETLRFYLPR